MKKPKANSVIGTTLINQMMKDRSIRTSITKDSFLYFFHFYYAHYVQYPTADFQKDSKFTIKSNAHKLTAPSRPSDSVQCSLWFLT